MLMGGFSSRLFWIEEKSAHQRVLQSKIQNPKSKMNSAPSMVRRIQRTIHHTAMSHQVTPARKLHQRDFLFLARLEAHGGAGGDVEPHAARGVALKIEGLVHLEEMVVAPDLNGSIAPVAHDHARRAPAGVDCDRLVLEKILAWFHKIGFSSQPSAISQQIALRFQPSTFSTQGSFLLSADS